MAEFVRWTHVSSKNRVYFFSKGIRYYCTSNDYKKMYQMRLSSCYFMLTSNEIRIDSFGFNLSPLHQSYRTNMAFRLERTMSTQCTPRNETPKMVEKSILRHVMWHLICAWWTLIKSVEIVWKNHAKSAHFLIISTFWMGTETNSSKVNGEWAWGNRQTRILHFNLANS